MDLRQYLKKRESTSQKEYRVLCLACLQPKGWCYCAVVHRFDPKITFVILLHFLELRRRIATGRMSFLSLEQSHLILGHDYTNDQKVNSLLEDPRYHSVILQPGPDSIRIDELGEQERAELCPPGKRLLVFVVDGTWGTAFKTIRLSQNLKGLPKISFCPSKPSRFRVRKQPHKNYCSTIEAIHETIEIMGASQGFKTEEREHDSLLRTFDSLVTQQVDHINMLKQTTGIRVHRKVKKHLPK